MPSKKNNYSCFILTPLSKYAPKIKRPAKTKATDFNDIYLRNSRIPGMRKTRKKNRKRNISITHVFETVVFLVSEGPAKKQKTTGFQ